MSVQITKTQIATAMAAEITDIVSSFIFIATIILSRAIGQPPTCTDSDTRTRTTLAYWNPLCPSIAALEVMNFHPYTSQCGEMGS